MNLRAVTNTAKVVTLCGYLGKVSEYWAETRTDEVCKRCEHYDGPGYCGMLHDQTVPDGDCLALLERDGVKQPLVSVDGF